MAVLKIRNNADDGWYDVGGIGTVYQADSAPASPHAGQLWLDTDATFNAPSYIQDLDGDTKVQCEESSDEDTIRFDCGGTENVITLTDSAIAGSLVADEDDMSSDSASLICTQQSIKAYVDTGSAGNPTTIDSGDDLDSLSSYGWYTWNNDIPSNDPGYGGYLIMHYVADPNQDQQICYGGYPNRERAIYIRRKDSGTWSAWTRVGGWTHGSQIAMSSGTSQTLISDLPDGITEVEIRYYDLSTNAATAGVPIIQLGDAGGFETTDYLSTVCYGTGGEDDTNGIYIHDQGNWGAGDVIKGVLRLGRWAPTEHKWFADGMGGNPAESTLRKTVATKTLSEALSQIRCISQNGTATFDGGEMTVRYR